MNVHPSAAADGRDRATALSPTAPRATAAMLVGMVGLFLLAFAVLGAAIGWPATLGDPASVQLPRLLDNEGAVRAGYLAYLCYSILFLPAGVLLARLLAGRGDQTIVLMAAGFAAASAALRSLGIIRWLSAMFGLAEGYQRGSGVTREIIAVQFTTLNDYAGAVGEVLGVALFAAGWLVCIVILLRRGNALPGWLAWAGIITVVGLVLPAIELVGLDAGVFITVGTTLLLLFFLAVAAVVWRRREALRIAAVSASAVTEPAGELGR